MRMICALVMGSVLTLVAGAEPPAAKPLERGDPAPAFKIKDATGKIIDLAELTAKGPVLVRLTCGCAGCDKELAYYQKISEAYKAQGLISLYVFREPDEKMAQYAKDKKLNVLYAVDPKGESWEVFRTKAMPANFLIDKGGKIAAIATGCEPNGLIANIVSQKTGQLLGVDPVKVEAGKGK
ncbi:MAG: peroxiredoxin family protein [Nitrospira sp.]|nr:peroxiredoxin family protein [Nitrospira sp.]MDW8224332.1 redoxin domain-containing protein [Gemmatales bacterium]